MKRKKQKVKSKKPRIILSILIAFIAVASISAALLPYINPQQTSQSVADFPFKDIDEDQIDDFCPLVRMYNPAWLQSPIPEESRAEVCLDFCDPAILNQARDAYNNPETSDEVRELIDDYTSGVDENEGRGGKSYTSVAECEADIAGDEIEKVKIGGAHCGPVDVDGNIITELGYQICTKTLSTPPGSVDDSMPWVTVKFTDLPELIPGNSYYYCTKSNADDCKEKDWKKVDDYYTIFNGGLIVCGDGANALKSSTKDRGDKDFGDICDDNGRDWFHTGKRYYVFVAQGPEDNADLGVSDIFAIAQFGVRHYYPEVTQPKEGFVNWLNVSSLSTPPTKELTVTLRGRNPKNRFSSAQYNDYYVEVASQDSDYKTPGKCLYVPPNLVSPESATGTQTIPLPDKTVNQFTGTQTPLTPGGYVLRIKEGIGGNYATEPAKTRCQDGGFTFYEVPFRIAAGETAGEIGPAIKDPYKKETELLNVLPVAPGTICSKTDPSTGLCTEINTALLPISTKPEEFVGSALRLILGISGIVAIIFFINAGYKIMTSAGNKEKLSQAREQITAVVLGLIFIILSIAILEFIGVRILRLPGFESAPATESTQTPTDPGIIENDPDLRPQDPILDP